MEHYFLIQRPALRLVLLLASGILLAQILPIPLVVPPLFLSASMLLALAFLLMGSPAIWLHLSLHTGILFLGLTLQTNERTHAVSSELVPVGEREHVVFQGSVDVEPAGGGVWIRFVVRTKEVQKADGKESGSRRIVVQTRKEWSDSLFSGTSVRIAGTLEPIPKPRNPGEFDPKRYFALKAVSGFVLVEERSGISVLAGESHTTIWSMMASARRKLAKVIDSLHGENAAGFLKGLLLAERGNIPFEIKQSFVDTGTIHILAVSGLHVAIVAVVFYTLFGLFRMPKWLVAVLTMIGLTCYMFLTGATASVVRATVMACVILFGKLLQRRTDVYQSLAVSALVILLFDSNQLFDVGFQLSYAAVVSIVSFYPVLEKLIRLIPERFEEIKAVDSILKLFSVSLAAQLGTLPFTAYYFERVSIVSLAANLIAVPVSSLNLMIGFTTLAASLFSEWIAGVFAAVNGQLVSFLLGFVTESARVPFAYITTAGMSDAFPFFYYAGLAGLFAINRWSIVKRIFLVLLAGLTLLIYAEMFTHSGPVLRVTVLDVGQGDAVLLSFVNGKHLLIDAGPKSLTYDAGERVVAPYLRRTGIKRLDAALITHPHSDHLGGMEYLAKEFAVGAVYEISSIIASEMHATLRNTLGLHEIRLKIVGAGDVLALDPEARVYILHPQAALDSSENLNNVSVVMKVVYGSTSILLAGDVEEEGERKILSRFRSFLDSDLLKVGHHGSSTSTTDEFLHSITPDIAIISVGTRNKFHHPSPGVVRRLEEGGIECFRTDRDGAVILESDGHRFRRIQWRSP